MHLTRGLLASVLLLTAALAGCVTPPTAPVPTHADANSLLAVVPEKVTKLEAASHVAFGGGNDIAFKDQYAYVSSGSGMHIVDLSDPTHLVEVGSVPCNGHDISVVDTPHGRIVAISFQGSDDKCPKPSPAGGLRLVNVTDPKAPTVLTMVPLKYGSHTATPWGDSGLIFNSAYDLTNPEAHHRSEIINISDPTAPKVESEFMFPASSKSPGCHDMLAEPERNRMICAGIAETMIWDMKDPVHPKVVNTINNPAISIHHSVATTHNGTLLIIGDEFAGVLVPGCHPAAGAPTGALWFYDIKDVANPTELGFFAPPAGAPGKACTAHNFNVVEGKDLAVSGFYEGGTILVDFKDPKNPMKVSQQQPAGGSAWAAYYYRGIVLSGDLGRGLDAWFLR